MSDYIEVNYGTDVVVAEVDVVDIILKKFNN